jgi:hypothetical protein
MQEARPGSRCVAVSPPAPLPRRWSRAASILGDNRAMATAKTVRTLALALPETSEKPCYGTPGFYVKKKLFARLLPDGKTLAVRVDLEEREALLAVASDVFFLTPHYQGWPMVLVRLARVERAHLEERLVEAWRFMAPPKLLAEFDASQRGPATYLRP